MLAKTGEGGIVVNEAVFDGNHVDAKRVHSEIEMSLGAFETYVVHTTGLSIIYLAVGDVDALSAHVVF